MTSVTISKWHLARSRTICACGCDTELKIGDQAYRIRLGRYYLADHFFAEPIKESRWDVERQLEKIVPVAKGSVHK